MKHYIATGFFGVVIGAICISILFFVTIDVFAETTEERKARLEQELINIERQIIDQQVLVEGKQNERQSLERDVAILDAQIGKAQLGIQARTIEIQRLSTQIGNKQIVVNELNDRLRRQRQSLGQLVRKTNEIDDFSLVEIVLGNENFSSFFEDLDSFQAIKASLKNSLIDLNEIKEITLEQKISLEGKQETESEYKKLQELEKRQIEVRETKKSQILDVTKGEEAAYQALLQQQQKTASQIRVQLFELSGGGAAIPFPQAVDLATFAGSKTGVSAALILAILEQESAYGKNIGSCIYNETVQGRDVMHPDRDQPVFFAIAEVLGFSPLSQQISCPWIDRGTRRGWGGAMGPSQFIPSTWAFYGGIENTGNGWVYNKSKDRIRQLTGRTSASNPFVNQDAFMATSLLMADNGASRGTYASERLAAIRYFAGWAGASNPVNFPYGDSVMQRKARLQSEIDILRSG